MVKIKLNMKHKTGRSRKNNQDFGEHIDKLVLNYACTAWQFFFLSKKITCMKQSKLQMYKMGKMVCV